MIHFQVRGVERKRRTAAGSRKNQFWATHALPKPTKMWQTETCRQIIMVGRDTSSKHLSYHCLPFELQEHASNSIPPATCVHNSAHGSPKTLMHPTLMFKTTTCVRLDLFIHPLNRNSWRPIKGTSFTQSCLQPSTLTLGQSFFKTKSGLALGVPTTSHKVCLWQVHVRVLPFIETARLQRAVECKLQVKVAARQQSSQHQSI